MKIGVFFEPLRFALLFSSLGIASLSVLNEKMSDNEYWWVATLCIAFTTAWVMIKTFNEKIWPLKLLIGLLIGLVMITIPTINTPAIILGVLIIVVGFRFESPSIMIIGIIAMLFYISKFYYSLEFTLLIKSIILMASGVLYIGGYFLIRRLEVSK